MSRKAVKMSIDDFQTMLIKWARSLCEDPPYESQSEEDKDEADYGRMYVIDQWIHCALNACVETENKIFKDLGKVQFDWENCGCGDVDCDSEDVDDLCGFWMTSTGVPTLGCYAGGDWEDPVFFVLYPETATTIRAYMPKEGNTWNPKTRMAFNHDGDEEEDENPRKVDVNAFRNAIEKRLSA